MKAIIISEERLQQHFAHMLNKLKLTADGEGKIKYDAVHYEVHCLIDLIKKDTI